VTDSEVPQENNSSSVLEQLARRIRESRQAAQQAGAALLHHCLDAGDALNEAQERVSTGWKRWLKENCFLSVRTALVYQQLANHRDEIEAAIAQAGELSLRGALRLIATPVKKKVVAKEAKSNLVVMLDKATHAEVTAALASHGLEWFLRVMPPAWRSELEARVGGQVLSREKKRHPNVRLKNLRLVHNAESAPPH
jgi:hypothetical protein